MIPHRYTPTNPLLRPHAPELHKRPRALDAGLIDALAGVYIVGALVARGEGAFLGPGLAGGENVVGFDDVVFDEGVASPAVDAEVAGAGGVVGACVADDTR